MKKLSSFLTSSLSWLPFALLGSALAVSTSSFSQVAINKDGSPPTDTTAMLEIKKGKKSKLKVRSLNYTDTAVLELSNRTPANLGTDYLITARQEDGLFFTTTSDLPDNINDSLLVLSINGNIGIGNTNPLNKLDVKGNINLTGTIKANGSTGQPNQVLGTNEVGSLAWMDRSNGTGAGNVGFGSWGDCSMNNIGEYNPVIDTASDPSDRFGYAVSVSGNYSVVGAAYNNVGSNIQQGEVFFYQHNGSNWVLMQKITDATGAASDYFGSSVSISGNYAVAGAYGDDVGANVYQGSVSIYQFNGTNWVLMQKITDATGAANDYFGISVSISGNMAIVGAHQDDVGANADQGSASIYQFNGTNWVLMQKITDAAGAAGDHFGYAVSISGNRAIIGAFDDDIGTNVSQGSANIYQYNGSTWVLVQKIGDSDGMVNDRFGQSVSISGNYAVVGSPQADTSVGKATIFYNYGGVWYQYQTIYNNKPVNGEEMGISVSISGNYLIVGEPNDNVTPASYQGSTTIYSRIGNIWQKYQFVTDPGADQGDYFGAAVSIDGTTKRFVIGVPFAGPAVGKVVFGKIN